MFSNKYKLQFDWKWIFNNFFLSLGCLWVLFSQRVLLLGIRTNTRLDSIKCLMFLIFNAFSFLVCIYNTWPIIYVCTNRTKNRKENIFNIENSVFLVRDKVCGWVFIVWTCFRFNEFVFSVLFSYIIFLFVGRNKKYLIQIIK